MILVANIDIIGWKEKKCRREKCDEEKIQEIWKVGDKEV